MAGRTIEEWEQLARDVVLDMLRTERAVTVSEMEARASDRTWNTHVAPCAIQPHHLTTARQALYDAGQIIPTTQTTRGGQTVVTWSLQENHGTREVQEAAARKRLLAARHDGWARRGGNGSGLIGAAGERATEYAARLTGLYAPIQTSVSEVLGVDLADLGEVDLVLGMYDVTLPNDPRAITVMIEVKNTRSWYYDDEVAPGGQVHRFLRKAARVQAHRPGAWICPVFIARRAHMTLVHAGDDIGLVVASSQRQVVLSDHEMERRPGAFEEVRDELGYSDLRKLDGPMTTNYHRGILAKHIPNNARAYAERWRDHFLGYDPDGVGDF